MPSPTYQENKKYYYAWRERNPERNKAYINKYRMRSYRWKIVKFEFLNILI